MKTYNQFCTEANTILTENAATAGTLTRPRTGNALTRLRDRVGQALSPVTRPVNSLMKKVQPFRNFARLQNLQTALNSKASSGDRIAGGVGTIAAPFAAPFGAAIYNQGQSGSQLDQLAKSGSKNVQIPVPGTSLTIGQNPKTDIGRRTGNAISRGLKGLTSRIQQYGNNPNIKRGY